MQDKSQLLKGVLEGCILKIVKHKKETYGYEVVTELRTFGFGQCTEGTVYPLLTRLEKRKSLASQKKESPLGPQRKYYSLTEEGEQESGVSLRGLLMEYLSIMKGSRIDE